MFRRLLSVGGFTLLSRITGFMRDVLMAWTLGRGVLSDAFIVAFLFPNYFRQIFGEGTINPAFLPRYASLRARGELGAAALFADRVFSWQMAAQLVILVLALTFMPAIIHVLAPGFADNPTQLALTVHLARITFPYLIMTSSRSSFPRCSMPSRNSGRPLLVQFPEFVNDCYVARCTIGSPTPRMRRHGVLSWAA